MAISFVGSVAGNVGATTTTVNFSSLKDETGATPTLQQGDIVIVSLCQRGTSNSAPTISTAGYTSIYTNVYANSTDDTNLSSYYKFMGATPDASVALNSPGFATTETYVIHVLRGVDQTTPFDGVTPTTATATGIASPNAPAITPATAGAWIYAVGGAASANTTGSNTVIGNPSNLDAATNHFAAATVTRATIGAGLLSSWSSGSFDPAAFTGGSTTSSGSVGAASVAIRPASTGRTGTAAGTVTPTGTVTAGVKVKAAASGLISPTGSAAAHATTVLSAAGGIGLTGSATTAIKVRGAAAGQIGLSGAAVAHDPTKASASGAISLLGQATATIRVTALASTSLSLTGAVAGTVATGNITGSARGGLALNGASLAKLLIRASANADLAPEGDAAVSARITLPTPRIRFAFGTVARRDVAANQEMRLAAGIPRPVRSVSPPQASRIAAPNLQPRRASG